MNISLQKQNQTDCITFEVSLTITEFLAALQYVYANQPKSFVPESEEQTQERVVDIAKRPAVSEPVTEAAKPNKQYPSGNVFEEMAAIQKHVAAAERERLDALGYKKRDIPNEPCLYKIGDVPNSHSVSDFPQPPPVEVNNAKETI